ncbi:MAG: hypothetical protein HKL80_05950 [Acidimicrobiales bacterium]|nr:hypothetical protein [Acidimicrobiales bacterium]
MNPQVLSSLTASIPHRWTELSDAVTVLKKRWRRGKYLKAYVEEKPFETISFKIHGPSASDLLDNFDVVKKWVEDWEAKLRQKSGQPLYSIQYRNVRNGLLGDNQVPTKVVIESFEELVTLLGVQKDVEHLDEVIRETRVRVPALLSWLAKNPMKGVEYHSIWEHLLSTVIWIQTTNTKDLYLRQIDLDGIDTKFVEKNQKILDEMLSEVVPIERVNILFPSSDFSGRYGFKSKPRYTRFRILDSDITCFPSGINEVTLRTEELATLSIAVSTVFVIENEITYLAFPRVKNALVVFGSGFALANLDSIPWLKSKHVIYWGDIDSHGFDILSRMRSRVSSVKSMLMDSETFLGHPDQWVREPSPTNKALANLTTSEQLMYQDLITNRYGSSLRLEQERIRFSRVTRAIESVLWEIGRASESI